MPRAWITIATIATIACSSSSTDPCAGVGCGASANPKVDLVHTDGRPIASGEKLRIEIDESFFDAKTAVDFDCTFGRDGSGSCATCIAAQATTATLVIACPSSFEIRDGVTTTVVIEPFGGGAPLASASFTPHGTPVGTCCQTTIWDPMSITIP